MAIGVVLLALALAELLLGLRFIFGYQKSPSTIFYGLFCIGVAVYSAAYGFGYSKIIASADLAERLGWVGGTLATAFFLPFSLSFPLPRKGYSELLQLSLWPIAIFLPGFLLTELFVRKITVTDFTQGYLTQPGSYFWLFLLYFIVYWILSITNLVRNYLRSDGVHRWMLRIILTGLAITLLVSVSFDVVLPLVATSSLGFVGSLFTSVWLFTTGYILLKR